MTLGEKLREERELREWSKRTLAEITGVSEQSIGAYEKDRVMPSFEKIVKLANALELDLEYLGEGFER